jgi:hypothetical protein
MIDFFMRLSFLLDWVWFAPVKWAVFEGKPPSQGQGIICHDHSQQIIANRVFTASRICASEKPVCAFLNRKPGQFAPQIAMF